MKDDWIQRDINAKGEAIVTSAVSAKTGHECFHRWQESIQEMRTSPARALDGSSLGRFDELWNRPDVDLITEASAMQVFAEYVLGLVWQIRKDVERRSHLALDPAPVSLMPGMKAVTTDD